jgi:hypothetical protein
MTAQAENHYTIKFSILKGPSIASVIEYGAHRFSITFKYADFSIGV